MTPIDPTEPPDLSGARFDFSQFHPLDHPVWACRHPGGVARHLRLRWDMQVRQELMRWTLCRIGRHQDCTMWRRRDGVWTPFLACINCRRRPDSRRR